MESMKYSFSWKDFASARNERYKNLREDLLLSDVTLVCNGDKQIKAHKVILSSFSSLFKRMFLNNPHPQPIIFLKGVAFSEMDALLDFIYHG
jgi:broad-like protein